MRPARTFALALAAAGLFAGTAPAATLVLWEGKAGLTPAQAAAAQTNDTYLKFGDNTPNGTQTTFQTGPAGTVGLLQFPNLFGAIPAGSVITGAMLDLCAPGSTSSSAVVNISLATNSWTESSVWTGASNGNGGVGVGATVATKTGLTQGHNTFNILSALLAWQANPASNFGLVIRTTSGTPVVFASSDHPNFLLRNNERPTLTITYTTPTTPNNPVPAPAGAVLLGFGGLLAAARNLRRRATAPTTVA